MANADSEGTLFVPVANPETTERLMDTAIDIANDRSMRVVVLHVVEVPAQVPLSEGFQLIEDDGEEKRMLEDATDQATDAGVAAESRMRYARDVATGIVGAVDEHDADALLTGWRGRPRRRDIILGSFIDRILGEAQCDVYVKRIRQPSREITSILVPVSDGPHGELAVELAGTIARQRGATIQLVNVQPPSTSESAQKRAEELLQEKASILSADVIEVETSIIQSDHVAGAITDETANHDLTILGASEEPFLKRKLVGSVAEGVGRSAASPVILTRRSPQESDQ